MANSATGFGFQNIGVASGVTPSFGNDTFPILSTYATTIGRNCLVKLGADGYLALSDPTDTYFLGVFEGGFKVDTGIPQRYTQFNSYVLSGTAIAGSVYGYVNTDRNAIYYARVSAGPLTFADVGANATYIAGTVSTITGYSTDLINPTVATTATYPWRITSVVGPVGNDPASAYNIVQVKLNASQLASTTGIV